MYEKRLHVTHLAVFFLIATLLIGAFTSGTARADSTITFTSTADFDAGTRSMGSNFFASNGVSQPTNFISYPNADYANGKTFVTWQGQSDNSIFVTYYDHTLKAWGPQVKVVNGATENPVTGDDHGSPSLLVDASGFVHIFCCSHDTAIQHYRTTVAGDSSSWTKLTEIAGALTYPHPILIGMNIYLLYRVGGLPNGDWQYRKSTDNGITWGLATTYLDFASGTAYIGGTAVYNGRIYQVFVWHDAATGARKNAYVIWLDTVSGNVFCHGSASLGTVLDKTEADASCMVENTVAEVKEANFGSIGLDATGNSYVLYNVGTSGTIGPPTSNDWATKFSRWNGAGWDAPVAVAQNGHSYHDLIVTSSTSIEAFISVYTDSRPFLGAVEGGDIQRWTWNGAVWSLQETILREASSGKSMTSPVVPRNHRSDFKVFFEERHIDGPANARLYAWGDRGLLLRSDGSLSGNIETTTQNPAISSGTFGLASTKGDAFQDADASGITWKWGNQTNPYYGVAASAFDWTVTQRRIAGGRLNMTLRPNAANVKMGAMSTAPLSGDFNLSVSVYAKGPAPVFSAGYVIMVTNVQCIDFLTIPCTSTVDGLAYRYRGGGSGLRAYTVTNSAGSQIGPVRFPGDNAVELRVEKIGTAVTWYYRTTPGSGAWTTQTTTTFATDNTLFVALSIYNDGDGGFTTDYEFDNYNAGGAVLKPGYRQSGAWTSAVQSGSFSQIAKSVTVNYTGASAAGYIDSIDVVDSTGNVLWQNSTDRTSGTSATVTIPSDTGIQQGMAGKSWSVRVVLAGDGSASPTVTDVSVTTGKPLQLACGVNDAGIPGLTTILVTIIGIGLLFLAVGAFITMRAEKRIDPKIWVTIVVGFVVVVLITSVFVGSLNC